MADKISKFYDILSQSKNVVFFGGAGVSTESGIPDFRSDDGLYKTKYAYPPEQILSHTFFVNNTKEFYRFYFDKMIYTSVKPNSTHNIISRFEREGKVKAVVTQNIDGLHQMAGSHNVFELHGSVHRNYCQNCGKFYNLNDILEFEKRQEIPQCSCGGIIKPDVVLYEEGLDDKTISGAVEAISKCDLLIIAGTSLNVYPAASLIYYAKGKIVLINKSSTPFDDRADLVINDKLSNVFGTNFR